MTSISKGINTPIVLKDKISLKTKLINYAIFFRLSPLPKSVASFCQMGITPYHTQLKVVMVIIKREIKPIAANKMPEVLRFIKQYRVCQTAVKFK